MRRAVWLLIIMAAAVAFALTLRTNPGNLTLMWPPYRIDVSVNLAIVLLLVAALLLHLLFSLLSNVVGLPRRVRAYRARSRRDRAVRSYRDGLLAYFEGRYGRAERLARAALADHGLAPSAALLGARAAQRLQAPDRRDGWLESARLLRDGGDATRATIAEIALDDHRPDDALRAIEQLKVRGVRTVHALRLSMRAHEQLEDFDEVLDALRQLERRGAIDTAAARAVRVRALRAMFTRAAHDPDAALRLWNELPEEERELEEVVPTAVRALIRGGRDELASRITERVLAKRYDAELVAMWPDLDTVNNRMRLKRAEAWLDRWGEEPSLLVALGRLCAAEELWGKAEDFFIRAQRRQPDPQIQMLLARLCEHLGRENEAVLWYREAALSGLSVQTPRLDLPRLPGLASAGRSGRSRTVEALPPLAHSIDTEGAGQHEANTAVAGQHDLGTPAGNDTPARAAPENASTPSSAPAPDAPVMAADSSGDGASKPSSDGSTASVRR